jgi:hypothetical protein
MAGRRSVRRGNQLGVNGHHLLVREQVLLLLGRCDVLRILDLHPALPLGAFPLLVPDVPTVSTLNPAPTVTIALPSAARRRHPTHDTSELHRRTCCTVHKDNSLDYLQYIHDRFIRSLSRGFHQCARGTS